MELVFSGAQQQATVSIDITNDDVYENLETLTANLVLVATNVQATLSPSQATVSIENDDRELMQSQYKLIHIYINVHKFLNIGSRYC